MTLISVFFILLRGIAVVFPPLHAWAIHLHHWPVVGSVAN
jgi:hypothetical protein